MADQGDTGSWLRLSITYPFTPKSTSYLEPGQFWSIPLDGGTFACGRVLQLSIEDGKRDQRRFLAGLMDWRDSSPPTVGALAGSQLLAHGEAHIKANTQTGGQVLGLRPLDLDHVEVPLTLDQSPEAKGCRIRRGFDFLEVATARQRRELPVFSTWGFNVIAVLAKKHFGETR